MLKIIIILSVLTHSLYAEEMKCSAGKCGGGKEDIKLEVIKKEHNMSNMPEVKKKEKPLIQEHDMSKMKEGETMSSAVTTSFKPIRIKQLFNVRTIKVQNIMNAYKKVNYGYIVAKDNNRVDVTAWFWGYVKTLYADKIFQKVKKGEALALVYSPEVYKAKQDYLNAIRFNQKRASRGMLNSAKIKLELLNIPQKEINDILKHNKVSYYTTIYAPLSGWIFSKNINKGSYFTNKKPLFEIVNLDEVWVEVKLFQEDLNKLDKIEKFEVTVKGIDGIFVAKKELIYPSFDKKQATLTLRLSLDNKQALFKLGMYAKITSSTASKTRLVIPKSSVIRKNSKWYVFLATQFKGEYEPLEVKIKPLNNKYYEVVNGLKDGEKVVDNALFMMDSDAQINSLY